MMKVKSRLFHLTKFIDFLIDSQFWGPLYALKCEADLAVFYLTVLLPVILSPCIFQIHI